MRVSEFAFQYAQDNGRKRIVAVHKAVSDVPLAQFSCCTPRAAYIVSRLTRILCCRLITSASVPLHIKCSFWADKSVSIRLWDDGLANIVRPCRWTGCRPQAATLVTVKGLSLAAEYHEACGRPVHPLRAGSGREVSPSHLRPASDPLCHRSALNCTLKRPCDCLSPYPGRIAQAEPCAVAPQLQSTAARQMSLRGARSRVLTPWVSYHIQS